MENFVLTAVKRNISQEGKKQAINDSHPNYNGILGKGMPSSVTSTWLAFRT